MKKGEILWDQIGYMALAVIALVVIILIILYLKGQSTEWLDKFKGLLGFGR